MDPNHSVLSHQRELALSISKHFDETIVLTSDEKSLDSTGGVHVRSTAWKQGQNIRNVFRFLFNFHQILLTSKPGVVFSHMTTIQSVLMGPYLRLLGIRHVFWYAHTQSSLLLRLAIVLSDVVVTSTVGSFPFRRASVIPIGQSIDIDMFLSSPKDFVFPLRCVHVGRLDKSKNISVIIEAVDAIRTQGYPVSLTFIGHPSTRDNSQWLWRLKEQWKDTTTDDWLFFSGSMPRERLASHLKEFDLFVHAFTGSLDKALLEAALAGLPIATLNKEFWSEMGIDTGVIPPLSRQILKIVQSEKDGRFQEIIRWQEIIRQRHSLEGWLQKLIEILKKND